jgi:hypothetical protein
MHAEIIQVIIKGVMMEPVEDINFVITIAIY